MVKIYTGMDSLRDEHKLRSWVFQIARHAVIDYYRRDRPALELSDEWPGSVERESVNMNMEFAGCVRKMIRHLPDKYREAIELTELKGLSQKALSAQLGISLSGAKSRVQRGRRKLRQLILECCQLELDRYGNVLEFHDRSRMCTCSTCG